MTKEKVIKEFVSLNGVGKAKAELLYNAGFDSIDKLKKASVEDITKVKGINDKLAKEIIGQLKEEKPKEKAVKPSAKSKKETKTQPEPEKKKEKKEEVEIVEEEKKEKYTAKKKPKLSKEKKEKLTLRRKINTRRPEFLREEWFRYKRISQSWRKPDGITSKMRRHFKYRPSVVRVGFRGPSETRGLHASGFEDIIINNVRELEKLDPNTQAARISSTVGTKKRMDIQKKAEELDIRILNM